MKANKDFALWLKKTGRTVGSVADELGTHRQTLTRWTTGRNAISVYNARRIEVLTGGFVGPGSWPVPVSRR